MKKMHIHILVCDWFEGILPAHVRTFPHLFYTLFDRLTPDAYYKLYDVTRGELPGTLNQNELYVLAGSRADAYGNDPWIAPLLEFIRKGHQAGIPMLGTCFGHQAVALALGGKVERAKQGWGGGVRQSPVVHLKALDYLPQGTLSLYYNHFDQVTILPAEAERIATSDFCENEAFIIGNHILCVQGHPEYTKPYEQHVIEMRNDLTDSDKQHLLHTLSLPTNGVDIAQWAMDMVVK